MSKVSSSNGLEKRPRLRFPGFDEPLAKFEIGNACEQLKETIDPRTTPTEFYAEYSMPAFDNNRKVAKVQGKDMNSARKVMSKPCVLINKLNVRKKRIWLVDHPEKNAVSSTEFVPLSSTMMSLGYLNYVALTDRFTNYMLNCSSGSSNSQKRVTPDDILDYVITAPSLLEQERIARFLETIDSKIRAQEDLIELLKKYKRGLLRDIFTALLQKCEKRKLKEVTELFIDGDWIESKDQSSEGIRLIQTGNVGFGVYLDKPKNAKYISEETFNHLNCLEVFAGDILISRLPDPAGRACLLPISNERRITAVDCTVVSANSAVIDKSYLIQFLCSEKYLQIVDSFLAGGTRQRISRKNLEGIELPCPSLSEQRYYGRFLNKIDLQIANNEQTLECLTKVRFFMLQQLFI